ncbi:type I-C CRISPR-associated protein Cas7/Csd2 [endosymbiont of Ridgeia piscesae]|jgi:CRISPR-associated protein Csd2|uniref:CRISPR-associated protein, Csd2 family n=1 Tax=endosymbiont of Ridgeia piscesae TaxID=54398 RepID=A0A0T5YVN3_9GAMM|nr:type I-C CRISPR-associated protein Cas7/Csd2 [endosymbiont of Ridgeia piscesae]KRT54699.1 CRISPR-associated protein, Csd2 family [endosymbiont of Ridgeia piscesae]KRT60120.1 CRISPR-associated protein, Csd2 family [endosymbiont of Ridgeia piscesae]
MQNRYDFIYLFDVKDGNPNGDPDAGNLPRVDAETGHGLVTDVCLKRKVRNFVGLANGEQPPYEIYVKEKAVLNSQHGRAYKAFELKPASKKLPKKVEDAKRVTGFMCQNFFDIRTFGAVMTTEVNCGQVRGPVQMTFARSVDPVVSAEHAITRMAVTTEAEAEKQQGDNRTMGRKFTIPYGLYRAHGFISAPLAEKTGFSEEDLELLWRSLEQMFEHDRSAARGQMSARGLLIFRHDDRLGSAPAHTLFDRVSIKRVDTAEPARAFDDYRVLFDGQSIGNLVEAGGEKDLGNGVTLLRRL